MWIATLEALVVVCDCLVDFPIAACEDLYCLGKCQIVNCQIRSLSLTICSEMPVMPTICATFSDSSALILAVVLRVAAIRAMSSMRELLLYRVGECEEWCSLHETERRKDVLVTPSPQNERHFLKPLASGINLHLSSPLHTDRTHTHPPYLPTIPNHHVLLRRLRRDLRHPISRRSSLLIPPRLLPLSTLLLQLSTNPLLPADILGTPPRRRHKPFPAVP